MRLFRETADRHPRDYRCPPRRATGGRAGRHARCRGRWKGLLAPRSFPPRRGSGTPRGGTRRTGAAGHDPRKDASAIEGDHQFAFKHVLIREIAYEVLPRPSEWGGTAVQSSGRARPRSLSRWDEDGDLRGEIRRRLGPCLRDQLARRRRARPACRPRRHGPELDVRVIVRRHVAGNLLHDVDDVLP
jgi:hypothetical protein